MHIFRIKKIVLSQFEHRFSELQTTLIFSSEMKPSFKNSSNKKPSPKKGGKSKTKSPPKSGKRNEKVSILVIR